MYNSSKNSYVYGLYLFLSLVFVKFVSMLSPY